MRKGWCNNQRGGATREGQNDARVGEGVRWSANRKKAWRLLDGKVKGRISLQMAAQIMAQCQNGGPDLPPSLAETEGTV